MLVEFYDADRSASAPHSTDEITHQNSDTTDICEEFVSVIWTQLGEKKTDPKNLNPA